MLQSAKQRKLNFSRTSDASDFWVIFRFVGTSRRLKLTQGCTVHSRFQVQVSSGVQAFRSYSGMQACRLKLTQGWRGPLCISQAQLCCTYKPGLCCSVAMKPRVHASTFFTRVAKRTGWLRVQGQTPETWQCGNDRLRFDSVICSISDAQQQNIKDRVLFGFTEKLPGNNVSASKHLT